MSFAKAAVRRFNDVDAAKADMPGPTEYTLKANENAKKGFSMDKSERFVVPDASTPGPGHYFSERKKKQTRKVLRTTSFRMAKTNKDVQNSNRVSSLSNSLADMSMMSNSCSSMIDIFFTPKQQTGSRIEQLELKITRLENEKQEASLLSTKVAEELQDLKTTLVKKNDVIGEQELKISELEDEKKESMFLNTKSTEELENLKTLLESKGQVLSELKLKISQLEDGFKEVVIHNTNKSKELEDLKTLSKSKETALSEQHLKVSILEEGIQELKDRLEVVTNDRDAVKEEVQRLNDDKIGLELDLAEVKLAFEQDIKLLKRKHEEDFNKDMEKHSSQLQEAFDEAKCCWDSELSSYKESNIALQNGLELSRKLVDDYYAIIEETRHDLNENEMKLASLCGSIAALQTENDQLKGENEDQKALLLAKNQQESDLIHCIEKLESESEQLREDKIDLNQTCVILEGHMNSAKDESDRLKSQLEDTKKNLLEVSEGREEIKARLESQVCTQETEILELRESNQRLLNAEAELKLKVAHLTEAKVEIEGSNKRLGDDLNQRVQIIKALELREEELIKRNERLKCELEQQENGLESEMVSHWQAEDELERVKAELNRTEAQLCFTENEVSKYGMELSAFQIQKEATDARICHLEDTVTGLQSELHSAKKEVETKLKENEELNVKLEKTAKVVKEYEEEMKKLQSRLDEGEEEHMLLERSRHRCDEMGQYLEELMSQVDTLREELATQRALVNSKQATIDEQSQELQHRESLDNLESKYCEIRAKYESLQTLIEPFRAQLEQYEKDRLSLMSNDDQCSEYELRLLAEKVGSMLGHQNHNQKIKHVCRINKENVEMKLELSKLRRINDRLKMKIVSNKENNATVLPLMKSMKAMKVDDRRLSDTKANAFGAVGRARTLR